MGKLAVTERECFGDTYYTATHETGLQILVYPKKGYASTYAIFGTAYGSVDTSFRRSDEETLHTVPEGIAHFLEHKLFESEEGDAFSRYAKTGANANAYTSFDKTCYLFSCTENFLESLEILLDFVQSPYFTPQTVQKEQGIIGQEIRMYDDDPEWRVMFNLLGALYHNNPVKIDIAGTVDSIAQITDKLLYQCYRTFYSLNNMTLCVAGRVEPQQVFDLADKMLKKGEDFQVIKSFPPEPRHVVKDYVEQRFPISVPLFQLGFKEEAPAGRRSAKELADTQILLELLASEASPLYRRLLDAGLINSSFGYEYFELPGCAAVLFSRESAGPKRVAEEIKKEVAALRERGVSQEAFEQARRAVYGRAVASLGSVESVCNNLVECTFSGRHIEDTIAAAAHTTKEDVQARLAQQLLEDYAALSVALPV